MAPSGVSYDAVNGPRRLLWDHQLKRENRHLLHTMIEKQQQSSVEIAELRRRLSEKQKDHVTNAITESSVIEQQRRQSEQVEQSEKLIAMEEQQRYASSKVVEDSTRAREQRHLDEIEDLRRQLSSERQEWHVSNTAVRESARTMEQRLLKEIENLRRQVSSGRQDWHAPSSAVEESMRRHEQRPEAEIEELTRQHSMGQQSLNVHGSATSESHARRKNSLKENNPQRPRKRNNLEDRSRKRSKPASSGYQGIMKSDRVEVARSALDQRTTSDTRILEKGKSSQNTDPSSKESYSAYSQKPSTSDAEEDATNPRVALRRKVREEHQRQGLI